MPSSSCAGICSPLLNLLAFDPPSLLDDPASVSMLTSHAGLFAMLLLAEFATQMGLDGSGHCRLRLGQQVRKPAQLLLTAFISLITKSCAGEG